MARGIFSVVTFVFGMALLARPGQSLDTVIMLLGVYLVVVGTLRLLRAAEAWHRRRSAQVSSDRAAVV